MGKPTGNGAKRAPRGFALASAPGEVRCGGSRRLGIGKSEAGAALVELALVSILLVAIVIPMMDMGRLFYAAMEVNNAASAGVEYGAINRANSTDLTDMQYAAQNEASDFSGMTATADRRVCTDSSGSPTGCVVCASGTCSVSAPNSIFVDVKTQVTVHEILTNTAVTLKGSATMRAQ